MLTRPPDVNNKPMLLGCCGLQVTFFPGRFIITFPEVYTYDLLEIPLNNNKRQLRDFVGGINIPSPILGHT